MSRQYESGVELQQKILKGIDVLVDNVASTLGPRGRNVILYHPGQNPVITKDGVTVAKFVSLEDPFENVGVQILKQAASQTNSEAGDGTTTSTVLARAIYKNAQKYIISGMAPVEIKQGMERATKAIIEALKEQAIPITSEQDVAHIASISANGDETIGKLIATAVDLAGKDGAITIEEARSLETSLDIVEGFRFDSGYLAGAFITDEVRKIVRYDNPLILITDERIDTIDEMMPSLEIAARESRPIIVIAENVEGQALASLIMNVTRGSLKVAAIKAPRYGEERRNILKDLALSVGATVISRDNDLKLRDIKLTHLGSAKTIESLKNFTTIVDGNGKLEDVEKRIESLKNEIEQTNDLHECENIQERITRLASGVAIIKVGAGTEIEMVEKKHRIEDALAAVKAAQEEGIVPGGGIALIRAASTIDIPAVNEEQQAGINIILEAVKAPLKQMAKNAGESPDIILSLVENADDSKEGYDFSSGKIVSMLEHGIVDPVKVTKCALQNAVSVVGTLLMTNCAIIER